MDNEPEMVEGGQFFRDKEIWSMFRLNRDQILIGTQYNGFFILADGKIKIWDTQANQFMLKNTLFDGIKLKNNRLAFGSVTNGLIITDSTGLIILTLNNQNGIQNNTVLSIFVDCFDNTWLGLDNGIDYVKTNIALSFVRKSGGFGTGYCAIIYHNNLFAGTNQGLFRLDLKPGKAIPKESNEFTRIPKTAGQVWGLFNLNDNLLCGHNAGLFVIRNNAARQIFDITGVWNIEPLPNEPDLFIMGTYYGFYLLREKK
jgi:ligand-binding sensor domain-containing protein